MGNKIYTIQTPDGEIWDVEGPDNATDEQLIAFAKSQISERKPGNDFSDPVVNRPTEVDRESSMSLADLVRGRPAVKPISLLDQFADSARNTIGGVIEGAGSLIDIPTNALGKLMAFGGRQLGLPDWVTGAWDNPTTIGGMVDRIAPAPTDKNGQMIRAVSQGVGGAATGVGAGNFLAKLGGASLSGRVGSELAAMPGSQAVAGSVGAGAAEAARQGGAPIPVQLLTGIAAGGVAPGAVRATGGGVEAAANRLVTDEGVRQAAARLIERNATNSLGRLLESIDIAPAIQRSGARPTLAEVTLDPGLAGLQRALGNSTVTGGARINSATTENAAARAAAVDRALGNGDPAALASAAEARGRMLGRQAEQARSAVGPDIAPEALGENLRTALDTSYRASRARTAEAYDNPVLQDDPPVRLAPLERHDIELPTPPQPTDDIAFREEAIRGAKSRIPARPQSLMQFVRKVGGVNSADAVVGDLRHLGIDARTQPGLVNSNGRNLDEIRELAVEAGFLPENSTVDDLVQGMASEFNGNPTFADHSASVAYEQAKSARDWWRQQFDSRGLDPLKMSDDQWRQFYDDMSGATADQSQSLADLDSIPQLGKLMGPFQQTISALRDRYFGDGAVEAPAYVRSFFDDILSADEVGLKTLEGWERRALDMASRAPDKQTAAFMQSVSRAIGARATTEGGPERRAALDAARSVRREQAENFETGPVGKVLAREDYGRFVLPESRVGETLVPPGRTGGEAVESLSRAAGPETTESAVRAEVRRALDQAGADPAAVSRVAMRYRDAVGKVPAVAADLRRARAAAVLQRAFERSPFGRLRGEDGRDPNIAVARLVTADDRGRSLRRFAAGIYGNETAVEGLRRGIANWISGTTKTSGVGEDLQKVSSTPKMIGAIERVLTQTRGSRVLTSDQRAMLNSVRRELRQDQFARSANRAAGSDTARNVDAQLGILRMAALIPGGEKASTVLEVIMKVAGRTDMLRDTLAEAMADPKFAAELLREQHPQRLERALKRIKSLQTGAAIGSSATVEH